MPARALGRAARDRPAHAPGWREYIGRPVTFEGGRGMPPLVSPPPWEHPDGGWLATAEADQPRARRSVVCVDQSLLVGALPNANYGLSLARAINDWSIERKRKDGLFGLVLAPMQYPRRRLRSPPRRS